MTVETSALRSSLFLQNPSLFRRRLSLFGADFFPVIQ